MEYEARCQRAKELTKDVLGTLNLMVSETAFEESNFYPVTYVVRAELLEFSLTVRHNNYYINCTWRKIPLSSDSVDEESLDNRVYQILTIAMDILERNKLLNMP